MKKLFTHENRMIVFNLKNILEQEGIESVVINEFAAGGVGDLPAFDTWPELWLEDESRLVQAEKIVREAMDGNAGEAWQCPGCQEINDASFQICWNCGHACE